MLQHRLQFGIVISLCYSFIVCNMCEGEHKYGNTDGYLTLGHLDSELFIKYNRKIAANGSVTDLYISTGGLYLLPDVVSIQGSIRKICVYGYAREIFVKMHINDDGKLVLRPFVYVLLYRPDAGHDNTFFMVYEPVVVYHTTQIGCLNDFDWNVEVGDNIGVFIPEDCIDVADFPKRFTTNFMAGDNFSALCPSQVNTINNPEECFTALFVNNSRELTFDELHHIYLENISNVPVHLNMQVMISPMENKNSSQIIIVIVAVISTVLFILILIIIVCLPFNLRRAKKNKTKEHHHALLQPLTVNFTDTTSLNGNETVLNSYTTVDVNNIALLSNGVDHDYDEPYFEPATEEEAILEQLYKLAIPTIEEESLEICEILGSGSFGTVHRGIWCHFEGDEPVEEEVAVKSMKNEASEEDRVKFLQEAAIMGQFNHPSIIQLLGVIQNHKGELKIIVNLMKEDLKNHLEKLRTSISGEVPPELSPTLLSYTRQIAFGMTYLSAKSFVHRDLAARNILVSDDGTTCKIADFGLSRDLQQQSYYVSHGGRIPVKWTAPEALHYHKYSTASDVWSYGCVLYEIWSLGYKPFQERTNQQAMKLIGSGFRLPPPPGCPKTIYQIMIKCWNPKVDNRPNFCDVVVSFQKPDFQILQWMQDDEKKYSKLARTLGAPIEKGSCLYMNLQKSYYNIMKKEKVERNDAPVEARKTQDERNNEVVSHEDREGQMLIKASSQDGRN